MSVSVFLDGRNLPQVIYNREEDFEKLIVDNADTIFGKNSIYIDIKHRLESLSLGIAIPDGILIDLSDPDSPEFYLVEVELQTHDFFRHIFPQVTKFFAFYKSSISHLKLTEKIFSIFKKDDSLSNRLKDMIGSKEIYKFLKDALENSQNILIIIDGPKPEFEEIMNTYSDTWGKMVKVQIVNHFKHENHNILTSEPPFQNLEIGDVIASAIGDNMPVSSQYTEEFHLQDCDENVKNIYNTLKQSFLKIKSTIRFNPTKYYVGVLDDKNVAFIKCRKRKIVMIVLLPEKEVRDTLSSKYHKIVSHSESNQRFWGGSKNNPNCSVEISDTENFEEIESLLQKVVARNEEL